MARQPDDAAGQFYTGIIECIVAFGVALTDAGVITRDELSRTFRLLADQRRRDTATIASQAEFEARVAPALALAEFFACPVGSRVIEGGKGSPPEGGGDAR
ncbi:MAG TPA: hypothetical protein VNF04_05490 [Stellaceae bacterium]|nr:hypothetical protein [Stellaceae bacterium]